MDYRNIPGIDPKILNDPFFQRLVEEGLSIQHRFVAEPIYAKTGKGYLKSEGVEELQRIKADEKARRAISDTNEDKLS